MTKISRLLILSCALLQGCNPVDDYMLGKDNTPQPKQLKPLQNKVKVAQNWSVPVGKSQKTNGYLKLKPVIRPMLAGWYKQLIKVMAKYYGQLNTKRVSSVVLL